MRLRVLAIVIVTQVVLLIAPPTLAAPPDWIDTGVTRDFPNTGGTEVLDLRYAAHDDFDRVVIDLRGPMPDYRTGYVRRFTYDGTGDPIPVLGRAGLWVGLTANYHNVNGNTFYTGPESEEARTQRRARAHRWDLDLVRVGLSHDVPRCARPTV